MLQCPLTWLAYAAFATSATLVRSGWWDTSDVSLDHFESQGMSTLVTFMVVFFVGYCYDRHYQQCTPTARLLCTPPVRPHVRPLCAPCAPPVRPLCAPCARPLCTPICRPRGQP